MGCYILWIAYSARRDKLKVRRRRAALAMQLTEVIVNKPPGSKSASVTAATPGDKGKGSGEAAKGGAVAGIRTPQENPGLTVKHNTVLTSVHERPVVLSRVDSDGHGSSEKSLDSI
ncbi:GSCOCG00006884001-RA-CDS [Cotesia congregata]|uniref:Uncharacterized protein n=1 Tax=Cotesia congregata TaxID=51543 RepID=A0A8J2H9V0_COTCN|nr:GSCOCG00006884001-RA-CDS [Cotesia congregata]CAG5089489.1 Protein of unknown function [Cotesia congregata]